MSDKLVQFLIIAGSRVSWLLRTDKQMYAKRTRCVSGCCNQDSQLGFWCTKDPALNGWVWRLGYAFLQVGQC